MAQGRKTGGRRKGATNKVTKELRLVLKELLEKEFANIDKVLNQLEPADRFNLLIKLLPYAIPKYSDMALPENTDKNNQNHIDMIERMIVEGSKRA